LSATAAPTGDPAAIASGAVRVLNRVVIVSALGYFVDIYDLLLFTIVRVPSLRGLGVPESQLVPVGVYLLNLQMAGLLVGGFLWGILGDKRGRVSVLFGSIALYSLANLGNAFVTDVNQYAALRFLAGVGLAGELGAAITLVSEVMPAATRGWGAAIVSGVGILGAVAGYLVATVIDWRSAFLAGGVLGLFLLVLRVRMVDSGIYQSLDRSRARLGDLRLVFGSRERALRYVNAVVLGVPIWLVSGILVTFANNFAVALGVLGPVTPGQAVAWEYAGAALGSLLIGVLSALSGSRRWPVFWFICGLTGADLLFLFLRGLSPLQFYLVCFAMGVGVGYWAMFVTIASEQFGTNLRSTVTTTAPNLVRGSVVLLTSAFLVLQADFGLLRGTVILVVACSLVALVSLRSLTETFGRDLDYTEGESKGGTEGPPVWVAATDSS
jgi:MFS family permease